MTNDWSAQSMPDIGELEGILMACKYCKEDELVELSSRYDHFSRGAKDFLVAAVLNVHVRLLYTGYLEESPALAKLTKDEIRDRLSAACQLVERLPIEWIGYERCDELIAAGRTYSYRRIKKADSKREYRRANHLPVW